MTSPRPPVRTSARPAPTGAEQDLIRGRKENGAGDKATSYSARRADSLIHAVLLKDRVRECTLKDLRGTYLDPGPARLAV
ncbi:hypothetical protein [Streptomyces flavochromogenes]|uniref:hypothetical protein n=1 Tax=Streptomyces flavochromogenes TaxID=68199 RepID=UPI0004BF0C99|nr:hypothetical protein [Streptomyces flavochromogenes]